jgi:hypothetical protein
MQEIPEEIQAMAWLVGQSNQIDQMMTQKNKELITDSSTIKKGLDEYLKLQRGLNQPPQATNTPVVASPQSIGGAYQPYIGDSIPPVQPIQAPMPQYHPSQKEENQLEFNLTPNQGDIIINLLKEISVKLTKQNNLLQSFNEKNSSKEDGIPVPAQKSRKDQ